MNDHIKKMKIHFKPHDLCTFFRLDAFKASYYMIEICQWFFQRWKARGLEQREESTCRKYMEKVLQMRGEFASNNCVMTQPFHPSREIPDRTGVRDEKKPNSGQQTLNHLAVALAESLN